MYINVVERALAIVGDVAGVASRSQGVGVKQARDVMFTLDMVEFLIIKAVRALHEET